MSGKNAKENRKVVKSLKDEVLPELHSHLYGRCDRIEAFVRDKIVAMEKLNKNVQSFILQEVKVKMQNDLFNANCTIDAVVEVLAESGVNIPDFSAKVDAKKTDIAKRKRDEADKAMREEMEKRAAAANEQKPAEQAVPEPLV